MALYSLAELTAKQRNLDILAGKEGNLLHLITELQGLKFSFLAGANANTNIALTGAVTTDTLKSVWEIGVSTGNLTSTVTDRTATTSITSAGNIQCTASTAGSVLFVAWFDKA